MSHLSHISHQDLLILHENVLVLSTFSIPLAQIFILTFTTFCTYCTYKYLYQHINNYISDTSYLSNNFVLATFFFFSISFSPHPCGILGYTLRISLCLLLLFSYLPSTLSSLAQKVIST